MFLSRVLLMLLALGGLAYGQTSPGFVTGQQLPAAQLNSAFQAKVDYPVLGLTMTGSIDQSSTASGSPQNTILNNAADNSAASMVFAKARAGAQVNSGDVLGNIGWYPFVNGTYRQMAAIQGVVTSAPSGNVAPTEIILYTSDGTAALNKAFTFGPNGNFVAPGLVAANGLVLAKTAAPPAPGAGLFALVVVAGTTAGTCKLVALAGTSATPVTVVDNVGAGC